MPGVFAIVTGSDADAAIPWFDGANGPTSRLFDPHCRYEGEEVAAVAAETPLQAREAATPSPWSTRSCPSSSITPTR